MFRPPFGSLVVVSVFATSCDDRSRGFVPPLNQVAAPDSLVTPFRMSPGSVIAGVSDVTLAITGHGFSGDPGGNHSVVRWTREGTARLLETSFLDASRISAVVPATLMTESGTAYV